MQGETSAERALVASEHVPPGTVVGIDGPIGELVVWRTADGVACVMDARCPHAWTHLAGHGVVHGCELVCLTHFWRFDTAGRGTTDEGGGRREPRADIRVHASLERDGWIYLVEAGEGAGG